MGRVSKLDKKSLKVVYCGLDEYKIWIPNFMTDSVEDERFVQILLKTANSSILTQVTAFGQTFFVKS